MTTQLAQSQQQKLALVWFSTIAHKRASKTSAAGFTLTEVLIVVVIASILALIAAPGWLAFSNRQRVATANTELLQMLRDAQTAAIAKRTTYGIEIDRTAPLGPTATKFTSKGQGGTGNIIPLGTEKLGGDDTDKDSGLTLTSIPANVDQYRFNFDGSVDGTSSGGYVYKLVLEKQGVRRCVVVETLLGAMSEGKGDECDA